MRHDTDGTVPVTLSALVEAMDGFVAAKGWYARTSAKPQTPRNLATSLTIEAAELLACFQWSDTPDAHAMADELADVVLYACQLAGVSGIDLGAAVVAKLNRNLRRSWDGDAPLVAEPAS